MTHEEAYRVYRSLQDAELAIKEAKDVIWIYLNNSQKREVQ